MRGFFGLGPALMALTGCRLVFGIHDTQITDAAVSIDAPDAVCAAASVECASPDVLRTCTGPGATAVDTSCGWGCLGAAGNATAHCGEITPAGGGATRDDLATTTGLAPITITGGAIDGSTGAIDGVRAAGTGVIAGIDFQTRGGIAVFRFASLSVTGPVTLGGTNPIAFVADGPITVSAAIDAQGTCADANGGPGGGAGGGFRQNGQGAGGGRGGGANSASAGGGAGHGAAGGDANGQPSGGVAYDDPTIMRLQGGSGGGGCGGGNAGAIAGGGGGGGALQLVSNTSIMISGTINAGGCGGHSGLNLPGGGGGSGGTVLLEAPTIAIAATIAVNGGGGGGGGDVVTDGVSGQLSSQAASGGTPNGGSGGASAVLTGGAGMLGANRNGGGGGAVGRIRLNTRATATPAITATISPPLETAAVTTTTTAGIANVQ